MPSIHKRPGSKYWSAAFYLPDGQRVLRSTKQIDRNKAMAVALELDRFTERAQSSEVTEAQAREVVNAIMRAAKSGEELRTITSKAFFADWMNTKLATKSDGTARRYQKPVDLFVASLGAKADKPLDNLTARDVQLFANKRTADGVSGSTAALDLNILRNALNAARRQGLIVNNPAEAVELPKSESVERGTFSASEVNLLLETAQGEWRTLILCAYFTGARLSDCVKFKWTGTRFVGDIREGVDLTAKTLCFFAQKTGKGIVVPLHPDLYGHLMGLATGDTAQEYVMPGMADKAPGGRHGLSESFKDIVVKAGIDLQPIECAGVRQLNRRSFHALRHSFTSALANAGVTGELRKTLTGHASDAIHQKYTHHGMLALANAIGKMPGLKGATT